MKRIFCDMDGVLADFAGYMAEHGLTGDQVKKRTGAFLDLSPMPGAISAVRSLIGMGFELWIASKPATGLPHTYSGKAEWILRHLPELKRRIILTHDKGLLGDEYDWLIDDRPHKANCEQFRGGLLVFGGPVYPDWESVLGYFRQLKAKA